MNAMRGQPKFGLRCLISTMALIKSLLGPLGSGFPLLVEENSHRYFRFTSAL